MAHNSETQWPSRRKEFAQRQYCAGGRVDSGTAVQQICCDLLGVENDYRLSNWI